MSFELQRVDYINSFLSVNCAWKYPQDKGEKKEAGGKIFLQTTEKCIPDYTVPHSKRR
jgi:hypothetical protein